ncbi:N6-mAMP deaminase isoform X1 [Capsicum annuum]|uniref:N6-mAMP deaminase isoform X1 n=1 Tax=Capsicum annuum TaxID=4072 RepID=UPI001FB0A22F|nr:N6-mAMP deaminase isoform X1 [Capsicum annuum]
MGDMDWWVSMPKIELHAHLNGSIRDSTLLELAREVGDKGLVRFPDVEHVILKDDRSLTEVFKLFDLIHIITTDHETVTRITKEVIEDFAAENVVYLELRTTPKKNVSKGMNKKSYMEAVLDGLRAVTSVEVDIFNEPNFDYPANAGIYARSNDGASNGSGKRKIYVRLLLSIDRRETTEAAMETVCSSNLMHKEAEGIYIDLTVHGLLTSLWLVKVKLALEMRHLGVVGIDLSGNPVIGEWLTFLPALEFAKEQGLLITLHCGEVPNLMEINAMLDFLPARIGHACCFGDEEWAKLKSLKIPVEICLTSNIRTETISSVDIHHFADLYISGQPIVLCTDDSGVFSTSVSGEYSLASSSFGIQKREMFQLARNAVNFIFAGNKVKQELEQIFDLAAKSLEF